MSSIITTLYFSNKNLAKPLGLEIENKYGKMAEKMQSLVGFEFFSKYEEVENFLCELRAERAFKEGFKMAMKIIDEVNSGDSIDDTDNEAETEIEKVRS